MAVLVDANILLRIVRPDDPAQTIASAAVARLRIDEQELVIVPQCLYEYYVVATRPPEMNGLGLSTTAAMQAIDHFLHLFRLCRDERAVFEAWRKLLSKFSVSGKQAHDARLVAAMQRHSIEHLLTFNTADFKRYEPGIRLMNPRDIAAGVGPTG